MRPAVEQTGAWSDNHILAEGLGFPDGPIAMPDGSIVVVEMARGTLSRVPAGGGSARVVAECGGGPNGAAVGPDGAVYVCNNGGVYLEAEGRLKRVDYLGDGYSASTWRLEPSKTCTPPATDGHSWRRTTLCSTRRADSGSRITVTSPLVTATMVRSTMRRRTGPVSAGSSTIYPTQTASGLSPDGSTVYWAETIAKWVKRRQVERPSVVAPARRSVPWVTAVALPGTIRFDSLAVEASGRLCVGTLQPGGIAVIEPTDGSVELIGPLPGIEEDFVTNICFGASDMRTAFITCSLSGRLLSCRWPTPGVSPGLSVKAPPP